MGTFTIGFTKTSAEDFFTRLQAAGVQKVIDVRLQNTSQLSGFAKAGDLRFFLDRLADISYRHAPELAPDETLFKDYRRKGLKWDAFETRFLGLLSERRIEERFEPAELQQACLLCSEDKPHRCHRRLVVSYLEDRWGGSLDVTHL